MTRKKVPKSMVHDVLTESGYRCAVPTCRSILAIDLHHLVEVSQGGGNETGNLLALCPTCHALHHRGTIEADSLYAWKAMLVALSNAFDKSTIDDLIFLEKLEPQKLAISGDGVLKFSRLISAELANFKLLMQNGPMVLYEVFVTHKGRALVEAWKSGNRQAVELALGAVVDESNA